MIWVVARGNCIIHSWVFGEVCFVLMCFQGSYTSVPVQYLKVSRGATARLCGNSIYLGSFGKAHGRK